MVFVAGELLLVMAIPFVAIEGYHTLLASRAGKFVEEPTTDDPGWRAMVDATPVLGLAEVDNGIVTGITLVVSHPESAGSVVLVPGTMEVQGVTLNAYPPVEAVEVLARSIRLAVAQIEVVDEAGWQATLGAGVYRLDSPDPVLDLSGQTLFGVGPVDVDATLAAPFVGRPAVGVAPVSVQPRRHLFWNALLADPPTTDSVLGAALQGLDAELSRVIDLPVTQLEPVALPDSPAIETMIRDLVAFPAGAVPGDRLQVRILDRTGAADLAGVAAAVAANGMEVVEIGNATEFDGGETEVIAPVGLGADVDSTAELGASPELNMPPELNELARAVGAATIRIDEDPAEDFVVTVVIGTNFDLANLY